MTNILVTIALLTAALFVCRVLRGRRIMPVRYGGAEARQPYECWKIAIHELDNAGAELIRDWESDVGGGGRANREYRLGKSRVLVELDRWSGFTISGHADMVSAVQLELKCN